MDPKFLECVINLPHRCMGLRLQPLSAAHLLYLYATKNPLVLGDSFKAEDLLIASLVCSRKIVLQGGCYLPEGSPFIGISWRNRFRLFMAISRRQYFDREIKNWQSYWADHMAMPEHMEIKGQSSEGITAPFVLARFCMAARLLSEGRAWSAPFGYICWATDAHEEVSGKDIRFAPDDDELADWKRQQNEATKAGEALMREMKERKKRK